MPQVYNSEYRDSAAGSKYPLSTAARQSVFPDDLFLDMSLYLPSSYEPPFFILRADGGITGDLVRIVIADKRRQVVCWADCDYTVDTAVFRDKYGRSMGVLVYNPDRMADLNGELGDRSIEFQRTDTPLESECARFYDTKGLQNIEADRHSLHNRVGIVFAGGLTLGPDGDVNLYGENSDTSVPLRSINNIVCKHAFFLAHAYPDYNRENAIRVETEGSVIRVGKSRDFN